MPRWPRHSCVATGTGALGGRGAWGGGQPRTQAPAGRARRTHRDDRASDGRCQGTRDHRSTMLLVAVPTQVSSFRLLPLSCRYGMLFGSDCNNNTLRDVIEVKRGDTVGVRPWNPIRATHRSLARCRLWGQARASLELTATARVRSCLLTTFLLWYIEKREGAYGSRNTCAR